MPLIHDHAEQSEKGSLEPIAICGMSCRLPGAIDSPSSLWQMLINKASGQTPKVPSTRFNIDAHFHQNLERPGSFNVLGGYFLDEDPRNFDPSFFNNMTPIEAMWLDPQQRKILEVCYECLENAGRSLDSVAGSNTAVFVGSFTADYQQMSTKDPDFRHNYAATGVDPGLISNRIGNVFNLNGPSFTINTACSSSVYATHMACHALRARDCEAAIVGGVNLILTVDQHMNTAKLGILSPTSTCHTFDATADGYGRAEGAGALYLKRLSDAIRDGDLVRGVIRSSAVNTNGKVPGMGITHPSTKGQESVVRQAYEKANLDPNRTAYLECHGTGTPVGDPIEVRAVSNAMNDTRSKDKPLLLGAIKANIGHSEAASGIFAIIKAVLMTESGLIPGVCGLKNLNPAILEEAWNVKIQADTVMWPQGFNSKRASVSSFGYGGTNGHVIIEDVRASYPYYMHGTAKSIAPYDHASSRPFLVGFSAHDKITLTRNINAHADVAGNFYLADLAHTLNNKRSRFTQRAFTIATEGNETADFDVNSFKFGAASKEPHRVGFIFTGQGAQWSQMGAEAIRLFPLFRAKIQALDRVLRKLPNPPTWSLEDELLATPENSRLSSAELAQPALTAIQIAIVDLLASWNISPAVSVGHSSGEACAAYAAGFMSAPEALLVAYSRGYAIARYGPSGTSMLAVGLTLGEASEKLPNLGQDLEVACENSPSSLTLSGTVGAIEKAKDFLVSEQVFARELRTGQAYHSSHMQVVAKPFAEHFTMAFRSLTQDDLEWRQPITRMFSSVTATEITESEIDSNHWKANLTGRVRFSEAVTMLGKASGLEDVHLMIEIGPHSALAGPFKQICKEHELNHLSYVPTLLRGQNCAASLLKTAGELFVDGYPVDLQRVNAVDQPFHGNMKIRKQLQPLTLVDLPPYQWNYDKIHWAEPRLSREQRQITHPRHDILGSRIVGSTDRSVAWRNVLRHKDLPWMKDHRLGGSVIFPAAGYLSLPTEGLRQIYEDSGLEFCGVTLQDVNISTALVVPETTDDGIEIQTRLNQKSEGSITCYSFTIESFSDDVWTLHCKGTISAITSPQEPNKTFSHPVDQTRLTQRVPSKRWYDAFNRVGFMYGPAFQGLGLIRTNHKLHHAAAEVEVSYESGMMDGESRYILHPSTIDACFQLVSVSIQAGKHKEMPWAVVPTGMEEVSLYFPGTGTTKRGSAVAWTDEIDGRYFNTHTKLTDSNNGLVVDVKGMRCVAYEAAVPQSTQGTIVRQPYACTSWKPDVLTITSSSAIQLYPHIQSEQDVIVKAVELLNHKRPLENILLVGFTSTDEPPVVLREVPSAAITFGNVSDLPPIGNDFDLVIVAKDAFSLNPVESVMSNLKSLVAGSGSMILSTPPTTMDSITSVLTANSFPPPTLRYDLPEATVLLTMLPESSNTEHTNLFHKITVLAINTEDATLAQFATNLSRSCKISMKQLTDYKISEDETVVIADFQGKFMENLSPAAFDSFQALLCSGNPTVWVTSRVNEAVNVSGGMVQGLLRTLRAEQSRVKITLLDFDHGSSIPVVCENIFDKLARLTKPEPGYDNEYWLHQDVSYISRILPNPDLNSAFDSSLEAAKPATLECKMALEGVHSDGEIIFREIDDPSVANSAVKIQIDSSVMEGNNSETWTRTPRLTSGVIIETGQGVQPQLVGQKVLTFLSGALLPLAQVPLAQCVCFTGTNVEYMEALMSTLQNLCGLVNAIGIQNLHSQQHLVLVNPSFILASMCKTLGCALGFTTSFVQSVKEFVEETSQASTPVTVIVTDFSALSQGIWRNIPPASRFVVVDSPITEVPNAMPFAQGASFQYTGLSNIQKANASALKEILLKCMDLVKDHPKLLMEAPQVVDIGEVGADSESLKIIRFAYNESLIKACISSGTEDTQAANIRQVRPSGKTLRLSPNGTYLLVGCLGGLGRSLATFMMERGAKHFAFVSRSGTDKADAAKLVESLRMAGADVQVFRADASNSNDLAKVVSDISATRPIKGVVHAAMVLQDAMFGHTMTLDMFNAAIIPKVKGALALDHALRDHVLDFFIMTSSVSGTIGNPGQTNYSAANTYLDIFARSRNARGLPATSLVLPMVLDVGVVAETDSLEESILRKGWYGIDEAEMLGGFEVAMSRTDTDVEKAAIIMGVEPQFFAKALAGSDDVSDIYWLNDARFSAIRRAIQETTTYASNKAGGGNILSVLEEAMKEGGEEALVKAIATHIMNKCSSILMVSVEDFAFDKGSIAMYGLDSMIGAELRNWLFKEFGLDINFQLLLAPTMTFQSLSVLVGETLGMIGKADT